MSLKVRVIFSCIIFYNVMFSFADVAFQGLQLINIYMLLVTIAMFIMDAVLNIFNISCNNRLTKFGFRCTTKRNNLKKKANFNY